MNHFTQYAMNVVLLEEKRLLKERLLYPSIDPEILQKRYDKIELCMKDDYYTQLKDNLSKLSDTERSLRKMGLGVLGRDGFLNTKIIL